jgi:arylsulfatase
VILISVDTLRQDHVGAYGYERDTTPALDRFAAEECVVYENSYSVAPWTLISHMTMFSGLQPEVHGVVDEQYALSEAVPTLTQRLDDLGYHTVALFQKSWIHERHGFDRGFDVFVDHERMPDMLANYRRAMDERPPDAPLFLFLHIWDVHCQGLDLPGTTVYDPPPPYDSLFVPDARQRLAGIDPKGLYYATDPVTPEQRQALVALYDGTVRQVDDTLADWIAEWRGQGLLDDGLLMITADHGEALRQREGLGSHGQFFDEGLRTPLIVRFPGGEGAGERRSAPVSQVDLLPTVLDVIGLPADDWLPGHSLREEVPADRLVVFDRPPNRGLLVWPWKLTWNVERGAESGRLVNLDDDPGELDGLRRVDKHRSEQFLAVLRGLTRRAESEQAARPLPPGQAGAAAPQSAEELQKLKALGYLGDR